MLYKYAHVNEQLVDIETVTEDNRFQNFVCIGCGNELVPKLGAKNVHHFAHRSIQNCSGETYLHKLGKQIFYDTYMESLEKGIPFYLERTKLVHCNRWDFVSSDCDKRIFERIDLTKYLKNISVEQRDGSFIPDLMLSNSKGEKVYIEIAVTHKCDESKRNSGNRIVEYVIKSEADLYLIQRRIIPYVGKLIRRYNIEDLVEETKSCFGDCKVQLHVFSIDRNDLVPITQTLKIYEINKLSKEDSILYFNVFQRSYIGFCSELVKALDQGIDFKSCLLCKYHRSNKRYIKVYCSYYGCSGGSSGMAKNCKEYVIDDSLHGVYHMIKEYHS